MIDIRSQFTHVSPVRLHYVLGANCYQHAVGLPTAMINLPEPDEGIIEGGYITPVPGNMNPELRMMPADIFHRFLKQGCDDDQLIATGENLKQENGFRSFALLSRIRFPLSINDFHCAFLNQDGKWEEKVIAEEAKTFRTISELERFTGYKFQGFYLSPVNHNLKSVQNIGFNTRAIKSGTEESNLLVVDPKRTTGGAWVEPVTFFLNEKVAYLDQYDYLVPLPALP